MIFSQNTGETNNYNYYLFFQNTEQTTPPPNNIPKHHGEVSRIFKTFERFAKNIEVSRIFKTFERFGKKFELNLLNVRIFCKCDKYSKDSPDLNLLNV